MKNFLQFLSESATQQAQRLGLEGDGHGGWYKDGEFVAKTEKGQLKFYNKRQKVGGKDPAQTEKEKNISDPNFVDPALQQQEAPPPSSQELRSMADEQEAIEIEQEQQRQAEIMSRVQSPDLAAGPPPVPKTKGTLTIAFGRFNPPHAGHLQLMDVAASSAEQEESDYLIVPSRSNDPKKNPLDADTKVSMMRQLFPQHAARIQNDQNTRNIFDVLKKAHNDGYTNVRIVGGADRVKDFNKLGNDYNGKLYQFDNVEVISSGDRDPDSEGVEGLSASRMRLAVAENDFKTYYDHLHKEEPMLDPETGEQMMQADPETGEMIPAMQKVPLVSRSIAKQMFTNTKASMGINEQWSIWEMAPKFDYKTLRENYIGETIFKIGQLVENLNTGLIGRIIRRGTNHLICVTEDNIMFKSWIKDVAEANNCSSNKRLVGTDSYRKCVESKTTGWDRNMCLINKYRKKAS